MGLITNLNPNVKPKQLQRNYTNKYISILRGEATLALAGFYAGPLYWPNLNLEIMVFVMGGKTENPEKNTRTVENQQQTHQTWHRVRIDPGHIGGRRALSQVRVLHNYIGVDLKQYKPLVWAVSIINRKVTPFLNIVFLEALSPARYF